jgi:hypothetical protein
MRDMLDDDSKNQLELIHDAFEGVPRGPSAMRLAHAVTSAEKNLAEVARTLP